MFLVWVNNGILIEIRNISEEEQRGRTYGPLDMFIFRISMEHTNEDVQ